MRITFVVPDLGWSGGIRVVSVYAEALYLMGHEVQVVSVPAASLPFSEQIKNVLRRRGWQKRDPATLGHFTHTTVPCRVLAQRRPVTDDDVPDADVVIATWWETAEWVLQLSARKGAKVYFVQGHEVVLFNHDAAAIARIEATYRSQMHYVVVSRWLERVLRERYQCADVTMISNGVDVERFCVDPRGRQPRPTIGFVYSTAEMKGAHHYLEVVRRVREAIPNLVVRCFGGEEPIAGALPADVEFLHKPDQSIIPRIYGGCDAWLLASRDEGFGLPLLEAMACRTPFISMETGAAPELAHEGGGMVVPQGDVAAMAEEVVRFLRLSDGEWRARSDAARAAAVEHRWQTRIPRFEQMLKDACAVQYQGRIESVSEQPQPAIVGSGYE